MERESGLSRNILLALVLLVVIIVIAVIVVFFIFPPEPDLIPAFNANIERSGTIVYLYHDGGDPLEAGRTSFRINGAEVPASAVTFLHGQDWPWSTGETIRLQPEGGSPELVEVLYQGDDATVVLYSSHLDQPPAVIPTTSGTAVPVTTITIASTTTITKTPTPTGTAVSVQPTVSPGVTGGSAVASPPSALFSASPVQGEVPLAVRFTDLSTGMPTSWLWTFGDGGTATVQNPAHDYATPGIYTVSLTVRNQYGTSTKTMAGMVSAGMVPSAGFEVAPREGPAPLAVQFTDLSTGSPGSWSWNFGDGGGSQDRNPLHLYLEPGEYSVSLEVSNSFGSNTRIQSNYVRVTSPTTTDVSLSGSRAGYVEENGYLQFVVTGEGGTIKIGGSGYTFQDGDVVQIFPDDLSKLEIDLNRASINSIAVPSARMFVNGELARTGLVSAASIPEVSGLVSTFTIVVPAGDTSAVLFAGGSRINNPEASRITITGPGPDASGSMYLSLRTQDLTYRGGASGYSLG